MGWTDDQVKAIYEKGSNILVAAAAGSGKTAVLVERIINKIINEKVDIDKLLVCTFTNAAASEMRQRILEAIYIKLDENPGDLNLQRQITLLNKASICTMHSFCIEVIKNNFYELDIPANLRIADTTEIELLKEEVLEDIFARKYEEKNEAFFKLVETYTKYNEDEKLYEIILKIYSTIQSNPFPVEWLEENFENLNTNEEEDFGQTTWGKYILEYIKEDLIELKKQCQVGIKHIEEDGGSLNKYIPVFESDINALTHIQNNIDSWEKTYVAQNTIDWMSWPRKVKADGEIDPEFIKAIRDNTKEEVKKLKLPFTSKEAHSDIKYMYEILKELKNIILEFMAEFSKRKIEKNIMDFNDIEHYALKILIKKENEQIIPTEVAKKYIEKFEEIAIDEYQDSNLVQEYILTSISNGRNVFRVGDVKQSIYRFRQAKPDLFIEKYLSYTLKNNEENQVFEDGQKIQLFFNFRSRPEVLDITNLIFQDIMSEKLGSIEYSKEEYLNFKAEYPEIRETIKDENICNISNIAQLSIIDLQKVKKSDEESGEIKNENLGEDETEEEDEQEEYEKEVLEAKLVSKQISDLLMSDYHVYDRKKGYRKVECRDICILLRSSLEKLCPIYTEELLKYNIPTYSDAGTTYLDSMEVQTITSLLKIIDNPMQDIPLVTVLRSSIFSFSDDELILIRFQGEETTFYEALLKSQNHENIELSNKVKATLEKLDLWKKQEQYLKLDELIWQILLDTNFYSYVGLLTNGELRQANLKLLCLKAKDYENISFKGLFNFISFLDKVKDKNINNTLAKINGENDNAVRIMSIHKSKGLEMPVVFLATTGKQFNMKQLNEDIILNEDIGLGISYINRNERIKKTTITKKAISLIEKKESKSEEMRVLYVALTRAREKLFISGVSNNYEEDIEKMKFRLKIFESENNKLNYQLVRKYKSYLDWINLVYLNNSDINNKLTLEVFTKDNIYEIEANSQKKEKEENRFDLEKTFKENLKDVSQEELDSAMEEIKVNLNWKYDYLSSTTLETKSSVSKIKKMQENKQQNIIKTINIDEILEEKQEYKVEYIPDFAKTNTSLSPMQKGTLMHLCVQLLDETNTYSKNDLEEFVEKLYANNTISKIEKEAVDIKRLETYVQSDLYARLSKAKKVYKEQPFYINIPANTIYDDVNMDDNILVQGIIDLYFIDENNKLVLVDFKTDKNKENLEEKYKVQLDLYTQALEQALNRKVDEVSIYSI